LEESSDEMPEGKLTLAAKLTPLQSKSRSKQTKKKNLPLF